MTDALTVQALAALDRGHRLFVGPNAGGSPSDPAEQLHAHATRISQAIHEEGLPTEAVVHSAHSAHGLRRLADSDTALSRILAAAHADRAHARTATRLILDAAKADAGAADTPMGRREVMARMVARLRAQREHISRSRAQARLLAYRLRRLRYRRAAVVTGGGRAAVLAAIRKALDIKGIHDPAARARWERGMDLVARRESNYDANAVNNWDSNAARGTPSKGAWQFIAPTFARYHQSGTSPSIHDLVAQACAFVNYAQGHYGVAADASNLADRIQQADPRRAPRGY